MLKKEECVICGSRECGLIRDPSREDEYVCASCLFRERDEAISFVSQTKGRISELQEAMAAFMEEENQSVCDTLRNASVLIRSMASNLSIARNEVWNLRDSVESMSDLISELKTRLEHFEKNA